MPRHTILRLPLPFPLLLAGLAALLLLATTPARALAHISRTGKYLYDEQGARFYIKVGGQGAGWGERKKDDGRRADVWDISWLPSRAWRTSPRARSLLRPLPTPPSGSLPSLPSSLPPADAPPPPSDPSGGFPEPSSYIDPLSSGTNCTRDLPYLQQLGVNAVRVYSVDPGADHDACMATLSGAGIYLMCVLSSGEGARR